MVKINKRLSVILLAVLSIMTIQVNAEILAPAENPPSAIAMTTSYQQTNLISVTYPKDANQVKILTTAHESHNRPYFMIHASTLLPNTVYKITLDMSYTTTEILYGQTGYLDITNDVYAGYADLKKLIPGIDTSESKYGTQQTGLQLNTEGLQKFTLDNYKMFYDTTTKQLSIIWLNTEFTANTYIMIALGVNSNTQYGINIGYKNPVQMTTKAVYKDQLDTIIQLITQISGSGLNKEQMQEAIDEALQQHDQQQKEELDGALGDAQDQITDVIQGYLPDTHYVEKTIELLTKQVFGYTGTECKWTLPAATNPMANDAIMWEAQEIDIGAAMDEYLTYPLRSVIGNALIALMCFAYAYQAIDLIYQLFVKPFSGSGD